MENGKYNFDWPLVGNKHITDFLEKAVVKDELAGAYIFYGPDNLGKTTLAKHFAKILLCNKQAANIPCEACPSCQSFKPQADDGQELLELENITNGDCHIIGKEKDKKNISIEQIREFIRLLSMSSFLGNYKIGIIKQAESLSNEASNALLKTLEEPREKVVIILAAKNLEALPKTIVSRSQVLNFYPVNAGIIHDYLVDIKKASRSQAKNLSRLSLGRPALAVRFLEDKDYFQQYFEKVNIFMNFLGQDLSDRFYAIEKIIGVKALGQESVKSAKKILEAWQGVVRDWILIENGHVNLMQNQIIEKDILKLQKHFNIRELINLLKVMKQAEEYIDANVSPKTALEFVAMNV